MKIIGALLVASIALCQPAVVDKSATAARLVPLPPRPDGKARVFVGESEMFYSSSFYSSSVSGNAARITGGAGGASVAGVMKFTINVMKAVNDSCPDKAIVVSSPEAADYFLRLDTDGVLIIRAKMVAFNREGEMSFVGSTLSITKDVKRFCSSLPASSSTPIKKAKK